MYDCCISYACSNLHWILINIEQISVQMKRIVNNSNLGEETQILREHPLVGKLDPFETDEEETRQRLSHKTPEFSSLNSTVSPMWNGQRDWKRTKPAAASGWERGVKRNGNNKVMSVVLKSAMMNVIAMEIWWPFMKRVVLPHLFFSMFRYLSAIRLSPSDRGWNWHTNFVQKYYSGGGNLWNGFCCSFGPEFITR